MFGARRSGWLAALGVAVVLCASGVAVAAGPSLRNYLLRSGEQPGYKVTKHSMRTVHTPAGYVKGGLGSFLSPAQRRRAIRHLKKLGFVSIAGEELHGAKNRSGLSEVWVFNNPRSADKLAKALYKADVRLFKALLAVQGGKLNPFALPGIHRSYGVSLRTKPAAAAEVYWVEGDCIFTSAQSLPHGSGLTPRQIASRVITGAESQHSRTGGKCGPTAASFTG